jgi:hypothetical protein
MISDATLAGRLGTEITGTFKEKVSQMRGTVGGIGVYSLNVGDKIVCTEDNCKLYERVNEAGIKVQSPVFMLEDHRVVSIGTIARRNEKGQFHEKSTGMDFLKACQGTAEVANLLIGKTLEVIEVGSALLPVFQKPGQTAPQRHYAWKVTDTKKK